MAAFRRLEIGRTVFLALLFVAVGCQPSPSSGKGFTLPDGDREHGQATFVSLNCHQCHTVANTELPSLDEREMSIRLGGEVPRIGTYGELVTAIINPSHRLARGHLQDDISDDGQSLMKNYNDVLTVSELTDLVTFLQSQYKLREYEPTHYPMYF